MIEHLYETFLKSAGVETDTRKDQTGKIFFALKGDRFNGNEFAVNAIENGAILAVIDDERFYKNDTQYLLVSDVLTTLQHLAQYHRNQFDIPLIAITGSNGKTTSKELIHAVLKEKFKTFATYGNLNNHIGVPLSLLSIKKDTEIAVIEMGANHLHEIESYCEIALPNFGIINNCGKAHLEGFGGIEGVKKGKGELYDFIKKTDGTIFINQDLDYLESMSEGIFSKIYYGTHQGYVTGNIVPNHMFLEMQLNWGEERYYQLTKMVGDYNAANVLLATTVGLFFGVPLSKIQSAIVNYEPDNSRSQLIQKGNNAIILDAYNANPTSMRAAILNFSKQEGKKWLLLGAMKEMGNFSKEEHQSLVDYVQQWDWDRVVLVGEEFKGIEHNYEWYIDIHSAKENFSNLPLNSGVYILLKGSRGSRMEQLLELM
jgi:UDP-N-acetylmuramoyl-tripeptide--D-alanyl-D-alanine ligase